METRNCQNCKQDFNIEPDDFSFYEKMKVPAPTWCPECRMIRRMIWRNHRSLYRRFCSLCSKTLISVYKEDRAPVMCAECWNGDGWDPYETKKDIDWDIPLFGQIHDLVKLQPRVFQNRVGGNIINSDYANSVANSKNIYLSFSVVDSEDLLFSENIDNSKNSMDCMCSDHLDKCYENVDSSNNYNCQFVVESTKNMDSSFLFDCSNCQNCCLSSNIRNKSFVFKNQQLSKEEYNEELKKLNLGTFFGLDKAKKEFLHLKEKSIIKYAKNINSINVTGDHISNSKDVTNSFDITKCENVSYGHRMLFSKDIKDSNWVLEGELEYECISGSGSSSNQIGCALCFGSTKMEYSLFCRSSANCFACVGLKNAEHCILNKQYSKEEYFDLVSKLKIFMDEIPFVDSKGRIYKYGEFFPYEASPFAYNETLAYDSFFKTREEALNLGFSWKEPELKNYQITINSDDLPDSIEDVNQSIFKEVIKCSNNGNSLFQCTAAFKITPEELIFYKQNNLPLPRYCPNCRHYERLAYRNKMRLHKRSCMCDRKGHFHGEGNCTNEFETSYAPERPEMVFCEQCYQAEVL